MDQRPLSFPFNGRRLKPGTYAIQAQHVSIALHLPPRVEESNPTPGMPGRLTSREHDEDGIAACSVQPPLRSGVRRRAGRHTANGLQILVDAGGNARHGGRDEDIRLDARVGLRGARELADQRQVELDP